MPVQNISRTDKSRSFFHLYNQGKDLKNRNLFNDEQDYQVFIGYLKDYLGPPPHPHKIKKSFSIKGRTYQGIPHQPKNYFNEIDLIAYSLRPDHFHLLLCQKTRGSLGRFIKSLSTRYAIFYNKKYQRTGPLFVDSCKSTPIKKLSQLLYLTHHLHDNPEENSQNLAEGHSSYAEYLGLRKTSWVKPKIVLDFFKKKNKTYEGNYQNFVEEYELDQEEKELLKGVIPEKEGFLKKSAVAPAELELSFQPKIFASLIAGAVFCLLFSIGLKNVQAFTAESKRPLLSPVSLVSKLENNSKVLTSRTESKTRLIVKTGDQSVNIRQRPTTDSKAIGKAEDGDVFEFISTDSEWYEVKLPDGLTGFISATYIEEIETKSRL